jgi:hypothetical protein
VFLDGPSDREGVTATGLNVTGSLQFLLHVPDQFLDCASIHLVNPRFFDDQGDNYCPVRLYRIVRENAEGSAKLSGLPGAPY